MNKKNNNLDDSPITPNPFHTLPLIIFIIIVIGIGYWVGYVLSVDKHWMEAPGNIIMVLFLPLTALTYLHFSLPKKHLEFEKIKSRLNKSNDYTETFSFVFGQEHKASDYILPLSLVSFFSLLGFYILFSNSASVLFDAVQWVKNDHVNFKTIEFRRNIVVVGMSFLGAFIWSIQFIFRRMMLLDLPPGAYYSIFTRMVYSTFVAVIFQYFMNHTNDTTMIDINGNFVVISFLIGLFPERALNFLKESFSKIFMRNKHFANSLPLDMIEGINGFHKSRLAELGIDNVQNLAHASLLELILKTPYKPRVIIDWMAQAKLCLEFKNNTNNLRKAGIRTILDLWQIEKLKDEQLLIDIAINSGIELSLLKTVCSSNQAEKSLERLDDAYNILNVV